MTLPLGSRTGWPGSFFGQSDGEFGTLAQLTLDRNPATMPLDYLLDYRKAQARAVFFPLLGVGRSEKLLKYTSKLIRGYANPGVGDIQLNMIIMALGLKVDSFVLGSVFNRVEE